MSTPGNGGYVTWGRYDAEHQAVLGKITDLAARLDAIGASAKTRRERFWAVLLTVIAGLVCPVVVTSVITLLHLGSG